MKNPIYIGIDGGATKTEYVAIDLSRNLLLFKTSESTNPVAVGVDRVCLNIIRGIEDLLKNLGKGYRDVKIDILAISIAGYLDGYWNMNLEKCIRLKTGLDIDKIVIFEDIMSAFSSSFLYGDGIVGIIGTGSSFYGRIGDISVRVGGWGHLIDDAGSGFSIGRRGLNYIFRYIDGRVSKSSNLVECSLKHYRVDSLNDLVRKIYSVDNPKSYIASFSKCVFKCASEGDEVALDIVKSESIEIAIALYTVRRHLSLRTNSDRVKDLHVSLTGSVYLVNEKLLKTYIEEALANLGWVTDIGKPIIRQSCGSIIAAIGQLGFNVDSKHFSKLLEFIIEKCRPVF